MQACLNGTLKLARRLYPCCFYTRRLNVTTLYGEKFIGIFPLVEAHGVVRQNLCRKHQTT